MVSVIYLVFAKINNKYVNKKNYLDGKKFKIGVFSGLITLSRNSLGPEYFLTFKKLLPPLAT
jgi:hypothetical protein